MPLTLEIVTPEKKVYSDTVDSVVLPTVQGEINVLPGHQPLMGVLVAGELEATRSGNREYLAVDKGFIRVLHDTVSVITEAAINVVDIDLSAVEEARSRAEKALEAASQLKLDPEEVERLEATARFAIAQQLVKKKRI